MTRIIQSRQGVQGEVHSYFLEESGADQPNPKKLKNQAEAIAEYLPRWLRNLLNLP